MAADQGAIDLTAQDIGAYFDEKGVSNRCQQCGRQEWIHIKEQDGWFWGLNAGRTDGSARLPMPAVPMLVLCCAHCSWVRLHASVPIEEWVQGRASTGEVAP